ncbi:hypothetical protein KP509_26G018300 [Ceratopteris richardii]|uniref:RCC1-like domain-containing protein n=1 Tax=Ceratopteris richardii TaxID=49495 RepID=A0A8T2RKT7_CERRI|nr:hypothetical protein KP509_26G018300 [Ceratopteris richardii]KAH7296296.1 hypothetical protein KP509_26G018300 [Ceratopteris richardii]KAH7296297.1 hypothetical protein KP509_26G018300 [Ceratopteris richardii]
MVIDTHGTLWAWGKSKRGQLGLGKDIIEVLFPRPVQALSSKIVTQIALGWGHALACTTDGKLYSWGYPVNGQLGYVPKDGHAFEIQSISTVNPEKQSAESYDDDLEQELNVLCQWEPQLVPLGDLEAVGVSCGDDHSLVLCRGGILLSFGDNSYGQLGRIKKKTISVKDWRVDLETCVTYIGSGLGHSLAICCDNKKDEDTTLFSWGWNAAFQLGRTTVNDRPLHVEGLEGHHICHVDGGRVHSVAIDGEGGLWTWGSGKNGRLGLGSFGDEQQPCQVESIQDFKVQQAVCGFDHTIILV